VLPQLGVTLLEGREFGDLHLHLDLVYYKILDSLSVDRQGSHTGLLAAYELVGAVDDKLVLSVLPFPWPTSRQSLQE
jgi:hypothetical protein